MSNPVVHAFFIGRALAEALNEQIEQNVTTTLSELGKFDAEQRQRLRQFVASALERAGREADNVAGEGTTGSYNSRQEGSPDLQATIDELRAEIAQLRVQLASYRTSRSN